MYPNAARRILNEGDSWSVAGDSTHRLMQEFGWNSELLPKHDEGLKRVGYSQDLVELCKFRVSGHEGRTLNNLWLVKKKWLNSEIH